MKSNFLKIEKGAINKVSHTLEQNGIKGKILYVSDPVVDKLFGDIVRPQIAEIGQVKEETCDNNTIAYSMGIAEKVISSDISCIVGMGGGRVLDVCKYAAFMSKASYLSIPTTAANDGLCSPVAVLMRQDQIPRSLSAAMPDMLLIDIDIIANGPIQNIKAGIGDTLSNYTALADWELAVERGKDVMNGYAYLMAENALASLAYSKFTTICPDFVELLLNSLVLSGIAMDFAGNSRPVSGSEHIFSRALDYFNEKKNLHGLQVALGTIAVLKIMEQPSKEPMEYLKRFGVDINPQHMGISEEMFVFCMQNAATMRKSRYTCLQEADLNAERLKSIYKELIEEL